MVNIPLHISYKIKERDANMSIRFLRKCYKYKSGKVIIKSDIHLEEEQIVVIIDIINKFMEEAYYEPCYHISRKIYYEFVDLQIKRVEAHDNSRRFVVDIFK